MYVFMYLSIYLIDADAEIESIALEQKQSEGKLYTTVAQVKRMMTLKVTQCVEDITLTEVRQQLSIRPILLANISSMTSSINRLEYGCYFCIIYITKD